MLFRYIDYTFFVILCQYEQRERKTHGNERPNRDIRRAAAFSGVCLWQIADSLGITDANFSRKLRRELPADEKEKIMQIIKNISGEDGKE